MTAARPTATRGRSAPVAIEVAIALAVSWKPLVKSKASAATTTMTRSSSEPTASGLSRFTPRLVKKLRTKRGAP
jgi:hypothetical protein